MLQIWQYASFAVRWIYVYIRRIIQRICQFNSLRSFFLFLLRLAQMHLIIIYLYTKRYVFSKMTFFYCMSGSYCCDDAADHKYMFCTTMMSCINVFFLLWCTRQYWAVHIFWPHGKCAITNNNNNYRFQMKWKKNWPLNIIPYFKKK